MEPVYPHHLRCNCLHLDDILVFHHHLDSHLHLSQPLVPRQNHLYCQTLQIHLELLPYRYQERDFLQALV